MDGNTEIIKGTAKQIREKLQRVPDEAIVRLMIGRPSLSAVARKMQEKALANGMTDTIHDELMASLKTDR
jgi:hypothetical protein